MTTFAFVAATPLWAQLIVSVSPAAVALGGVITALVVGARSATAAREEARKLAQAERDHVSAEAQAERRHRERMERDGLFRTERLALYRRLIAAADRALAAETFGALEPDDLWRGERMEARVAWESGPYAETRLIASRPVVDAATAISTRLEAGSMNDAMRAWSRENTTPGEPSPEERNAALDRMHASRIEDGRLLAALVTGCRDDLEALGERVEARAAAQLGGLQARAIGEVRNP